MEPYVLHLNEMLKRFDSMKPDEAATFRTHNTSNHERESSHRVALWTLDRTDRHAAWNLALDAFGPQATSPAWYVALRGSAQPDERQLKDAHSMLYMAQCAAHALIVRDFIVAGGFTQADYDMLTQPWREVVGKLHPDDAEMRRFSGIETVTSRRQSAQEIYETLEEAALLDSPGMRIPGTFDGRDCTQGVSYCSSPFSGDPIGAYTLDVETWDPAVADRAIARVSAEHDADARSVLFVAAETWGVRLRQVQGDSEIPPKIADSIIRAIGEGRVIVERPIPEPEWFESEYPSAAALLAQLTEAGFQFHAQPPEAPEIDEVDDYILAGLEDDTFAFVRLSSLGQAASKKLLHAHIFIEEDWAENLPDLMNAYFRVECPHVFISGNGWVVRLVSDGNHAASEADLNTAAHIVRNALGGKVFYDS
ncbi:hypothetical protein [Cryobacterium sp. BB307]|uniref:hypothetical protein n=1 Tax=Cryobacterium sp. BB307 TaxID=2716317 RepID=UPI001447A00C|nr:hypothetical protein [Cryobacterium sp. BB307]